MYITLKTDYAIRIVDCLSKTKDIKCAREVAEETCVPLRFAKNILQTLAQKGIIDSQRGVNGGYKFVEERGEVSLHDIFKAMDEPTIISRCQKAEYECSCSLKKQCVSYDIFMQISTEVENKLRNAKFC